MTQAGDLRFRVRFDKRTEVEGSYGGKQSDWSAQFTRWADIRPLKGSEPVVAKRLTGIQPVIIIVRRDSDTETITSGWRACEVDGDAVLRTYALKTAVDMERNQEFITMMAESGAGDA